MKNRKSSIAIPPGATINEQLVDKDMSYSEFAARMEMSQEQVGALIKGGIPLTVDLAKRLEKVLGAPSSFWLNLEFIYREKLREKVT